MTVIDRPTPDLPQMNRSASKMFERLAREVSAGEHPHEVVEEKRSDVLIARAVGEAGGSVIVKLWNRPTLKGALRRLTHTNAGYREWRALNALHHHGVSVPQPFTYVRLLDRRCRHTEALIIEDLGVCEHAMARAHSFIEAADWPGLERLDHDLIETTAALLDAGIVDVDHRMNNFMVTPAGRLVRVDLEHGIPLTWPLGRRRLGVMLGTLIGSYVFAVQPRTFLAEAFADRLARRLDRAPSSVFRRARQVVESMLRRQWETCGVESRVALGW